MAPAVANGSYQSKSRTYRGGQRRPVLTLSESRPAMGQHTPPPLDPEFAPYLPELRP